MAEGPGLDLSKLPAGVMGWRHFVEQIQLVDDSSERYFLELKSAIDLNETPGRVKVTKFILGAANRDPVIAARRFQGHALMVLGVSKGSATGIPHFEAKDLAKVVDKHIGVPGPLWDYHEVPIDTDHSVIIIDVDPPIAADQPVINRADGGQGKDVLANGDVFIRLDGETTKTKGDQLAALVARGKRAQTPDVGLSVEILGTARSYTCDTSILESYIARTKTRLWNAYPPDPKSEAEDEGASSMVAKAMGLPPGIAVPGAAEVLAARRMVTQAWGMTEPDKRTRDQYAYQIEKWEEEAREAWPDMLDGLAAIVWPGLKIRVTNLSKTYLEEVEIIIHLAGDVEAVDKETSRNYSPRSELPDPPREWGPRQIDYGPTIDTSFLYSANSYAPNISSPYGSVRFTNGGSVTLDFDLKELRPQAIFTSDDDDDFVLILRDREITEIRGSWKVTVKGHHEVYEGEFTVEVTPETRVFTDHIRSSFESATS